MWEELRQEIHQRLVDTALNSTWKYPEILRVILCNVRFSELLNYRLILAPAPVTAPVPAQTLVEERKQRCRDYSAAFFQIKSQANHIYDMNACIKPSPFHLSATTSDTWCESE